MFARFAWIALEAAIVAVVSTVAGDAAKGMFAKKEAKKKGWW
jgi:hypothetical protein